MCSMILSIGMYNLKHSFEKLFYPGRNKDGKYTITVYRYLQSSHFEQKKSAVRIIQRTERM